MSVQPAAAGAPMTAGARLRALVVDDDPTNVLYLRTLLNWEGFDVIEAGDGVEAVERFLQERPDIVFMDVMMPRMDGYEATRRIKAVMGEVFVPVIFLTALSDDDSLAKCVTAGGDDFLTKPFNQVILRAKTQALARIRALNQQVHRTNEVLRVMQGARERDDEIAKRVFRSALAGNSRLLEDSRQWLRPATTFSGDFLLTHDRPDGGLHLLLGDFTGHGLSAALGAIPVSEVFRAMTSKGFAVRDILMQLHHKLRTLLPQGMFLSVLVAGFNPEKGEVEVWNGGMPDLLVVDGLTGRIRQRIASTHLPLGIAAAPEDVGRCEHLRVTSDDHLVMCSDGLLEARNPQGEEFGEDRFMELMSRGIREDCLIHTLTEGFDRFCAGHAQDDDISLVDVPCRLVFRTPEREDRREPTTVSRPLTAAPAAADEAESSWRWTLELCAPALRNLDPVPHVISQLLELPGFRAHQSSFFTVLAELYSNALHHGVLQLSSLLKSRERGFDEYERLREERLAVLRDGSVRIDLEYQALRQGGRLLLRVTDSGPGFDAAAFRERSAAEYALSGRGITLVRQFCQSLHYHPPGNQVEAVFAWKC